MVTGMALLLTVPAARSKAALSKIFISGGKLSQPIEIADKEFLRKSNPWFGTFIPAWNQTGVQHSQPPITAKLYEISFYATFSAKEAPKIIYVVYYAVDPETHHGFVYLPGRQEQWYPTNAASILRPNQDGRWNVADPAWCDALNAIIARAEQQAKSST
jgi:hypothetical protein